MDLIGSSSSDEDSSDGGFNEISQLALQSKVELGKPKVFLAHLLDPQKKPENRERKRRQAMAREKSERDKQELKQQELQQKLEQQRVQDLKKRQEANSEVKKRREMDLHSFRAVKKIREDQERQKRVACEVRQKAAHEATRRAASVAIQALVFSSDATIGLDALVSRCSSQLAASNAHAAARDAQRMVREVSHHFTEPSSLHLQLTLSASDESSSSQDIATNVNQSCQTGGSKEDSAGSIDLDQKYAGSSTVVVTPASLGSQIINAGGGKGMLERIDVSCRSPSQSSIASVNASTSPCSYLLLQLPASLTQPDQLPQSLSPAPRPLGKRTWESEHEVETTIVLQPRLINAAAAGAPTDIAAAAAAVAQSATWWNVDTQNADLQSAGADADVQLQEALFRSAKEHSQQPRNSSRTIGI